MKRTPFIIIGFAAVVISALAGLSATAPAQQAGLPHQNAPQSRADWVARQMLLSSGHSLSSARNPARALDFGFRGGPPSLAQGIGQPPISNSKGVFFEVPSYMVGYEPFVGTAGDFNGDGKPDLLVSSACGSDPNCANHASNITVLLNNGDGTFRNAGVINSGANAFATGDFNGDGKLDFVIETGVYDVAVFLGNGDGTFQSPVTYPVQNQPNSLAVGDVNGDGKLDIVTGNYTGSISVLFGNGDGTFRSASSYAAGGKYLSIVLGDFNHDGKLDVAAGNEVANQISILLNNGQGQFPSFQTFASGTNPIAITLGDFNGDGNLDVATANNSGDSISVSLGKGDGTFQTHQDYAVGFNPSALGAADFNGDGHLDLAVAVESGVAILDGKGDGTFAQVVDIPTQTGPYGLAVANFNGKPSLAAVLPGCTNYPCIPGLVSVALGNGDGTFQGVNNYGTGGSAYAVVGSPVAGDFNGDGSEDIVVPNSSTTIGIFLNQGYGYFQPPVTYNVGLPFTALAAGDFNQDHKLDLVTTNSDTVSVLLGRGDGTFNPPVQYASGASTYWVAVADVNGDGKPDVITSNGGGKVSILLGNGDGTFQAPVSYDTGANYATYIAVADLNGDGKPDLLINSTINTISVLLNKGNGTFGPYATYQTGYEPSGIAAGDFNHDGRIDLAVSTLCGNDPQCMEGGSISILLGNGDGTFQPQVSYVVAGGYPGAIAAADFNGDGNLDLALPSGDYLFLFPGKSDGTFGEPLLYPTTGPAFGILAFGIVVSDFNSDGQPDAAVLTSGSSVGNFPAVAVLLNATGTFVTVGISPNPSEKGEPVTFTATVAGSLKGERKPTGTVKFYDGATKVGKATLSHGVATLTYSGLSVGRHFIAARYSGDSKFNGNKSKSIVQVVNK
jgi:hypothetical protein